MDNNEDAAEELPDFNNRRAAHKSQRSGKSSKSGGNRSGHQSKRSGNRQDHQALPGESEFGSSIMGTSNVLSSGVPNIRSFANQPDSEPNNGLSHQHTDQRALESFILQSNSSHKKSHHPQNHQQEARRNVYGDNETAHDQLNMISIDTDDAGIRQEDNGAKDPINLASNKPIAVQRTATNNLMIQDEYMNGAGPRKSLPDTQYTTGQHSVKIGASPGGVTKSALKLNTKKISLLSPNSGAEPQLNNFQSSARSNQSSGRRATVSNPKTKGLLNNQAMRRVQILANVDKEKTQDPYAGKSLAQDLRVRPDDVAAGDRTGAPGVIIQDMPGGGAERHGFTNADAKADGSIKDSIAHSGSVLSRNATDKLFQQDDIEEVEAPKKVEKPRPAWKIKVQKIILENYYYIGLMSVVTLYVLFIDDIRMLTMPKSADLGIDLTILFALLLYSIELILSVFVLQDYFLSFYFWVDLLSFLSMVPDMQFMMEEIEQGASGATNGADIAKTSRATRVIRIIRIIRLIRLLRIVKIYNQVRTGQKIKNQKMQAERESKRLARKKGNSLRHLQTTNFASRDSVAIKADQLNLEEELDSFEMELLRVDRDYADKVLDEELTLQSLFHREANVEDSDDEYKDASKSGMSSISEFDGDDAARRKKELMNKEDEEEEQTLESNISKKLSDSITKVVIVLVLLLLFLLPVLDIETHLETQLLYDNSVSMMKQVYEKKSSWFAYQMTVEQTISSVNMYDEDLQKENLYPAIGLIVVDPAGEPWNDNLITLYPNEGFVEIDVDEYRSTETNVAVSTTDTGIEFSLSYSLKHLSKVESAINLARTIWVVIVLAFSAIYFSNATNKLVLHPLQRMLEIVKKIAKDPSSAAASEEMQNAGVFTFMNKNVGGKDTNLETHVLEQAIEKIGHLLTLGFGEAGSTIIAQNISSGGDMNPMMPGQKIYAIFGFCFVHHFSVCTEVLQEDVITFVNQIAEVVHTVVTKYGGSANKNLGDAYLLVWKFPNPQELKSKEPLDTIKFSQENRTIADMSIFSFLKVLARISKYQHIRKYRKHAGLTAAIPNYKVKMGFGLHQGWAIEGAIGSYFKIDASYLSPNVNMASRLEMATMQYGVDILISGKLMPICTKEVKKLLREVDVIKVKGSDEPIKIFTVDVQTEDIAEVTDRFKKLIIKEKKRMLEREKFVLWESLKRKAMSTISVFRSDNDFSDLRKNYNKIFNAKWREAYRAYINGDWADAHRMLKEGQEICPDDGPTKTILRVIDNMSVRPGYNAPADWQGWRALTEK